MNYLNIVSTIIFFLLNFTFSNAQTITFSETFGSSGIERIGGLQVNTQKDIFVCGIFSNNFNIGNKQLLINGLEDIFIAKKNGNNETVWAKRIGSSDRDKITGFRLFEDTVLYFSGTFWDNIVFDTFSLSANGNALFIAKYDTTGTAIWVHQINGTGLRSISDGVTDMQGNYFVTGSFSNNLYFPNDTLVCKGIEDAFVAKYDPNGNFLWANSIGFEGQTIATTLTSNELNEIYIAGQFNGRVILGNDTLWAASQDFDIFLAQYSSTGNLIFGKRFGGIYDDVNPKLGIGSFGKVVIAGSFVGLLNFDQLSIQTNNLDSDIFLTVLTNDGITMHVEQFGGNQHDILEHLTVNNDDYYLSGYFLNSTQIGNIILNTTPLNVQNLFIHTAEGSLLQPSVISYPTTNPSVSTFVVPYFKSSNSPIVIAGTFQGAINFPSAVPSPVSNGFSDIFLVGIGLPPLPTFSLRAADMNCKLFPNPTNSVLNIDIQDIVWYEPIEIELINIIGQIEKRWIVNENQLQMDVSNLPKGIYFVKITLGNQNIIKRLIKD